MREKKNHLYVDSEERTLLLHSLVELKNQLIQQGISIRSVRRDEGQTKSQNARKSLSINKKLIQRGIPAEQVRFIHEASTDAQKKELFAKVRSGEVRVLFGSTQKMGADTNCQDRLIAIHNLDCPWKPSCVGRILRTFKIKKNVEVTDNGKDDF